MRRKPVVTLDSSQLQTLSRHHGADDTKRAWDLGRKNVLLKKLILLQYQHVLLLYCQRIEVHVLLAVLQYQQHMPTLFAQNPANFPKPVASKIKI